jgi:hypothetical protein
MELDSEYLKKISSLENRLRGPQQIATPPTQRQLSILNYTEKDNITVKKIENFEPFETSLLFPQNLKRKLQLD